MLLFCSSSSEVYNRRAIFACCNSVVPFNYAVYEDLRLFEFFSRHGRAPLFHQRFLKDTNSFGLLAIRLRREITFFRVPTYKIFLICHSI